LHYDESHFVVKEAHFGIFARGGSLRVKSRGTGRSGHCLSRESLVGVFAVGIRMWALSNITGSYQPVGSFITERTGAYGSYRILVQY
jgi:hypothetical protein